MNYRFSPYLRLERLPPRVETPPKEPPPPPAGAALRVILDPPNEPTERLLLLLEGVDMVRLPPKFP